MATSAAFQSDIVLKVRPPDAQSEVPKFKNGSNLISWIQPAVNEAVVSELQKKEMTVVGVSTQDCLLEHFT